MNIASRLLAPVLLGGVALIGALLVLTGGDDPYVVRAVYADANGLTKDYDVKIDGVPAGTIKKVDLDAHDRAVLTLELDKGASPIGAGARALARPANLLGEKYIDLQLGDRRRPQPSGSVIPISRTGAPVELDDVLNTLDAGTRARLRILINEAGTALSGRGAELSAMLGALPDALDSARRVVADVNTENARLRRTISAADRVAASVDARRDDLQRVVGGAASALHAVAQRRRELGATVASAPGALTQLNGTLAELEQASSDLDPASRALRRAAPSLRRLLTALPSFAGQASGTLDEAQRLAPELSNLGRRATPDIRRLGLTAGRLGSFARDLAPVVRSLDRGALKDAIDLMHGWSQVVSRSDGLGHVFRARLTIDPELLTSALTHYGSGQTPPRARAPRKPARERPAPSAAPPAAPATPAAAKPAPRLPLPLPAVTQVVDDVGGAVKDVLAPLLGGLGPGGDRQAAPPPGGGDALRLFDYLFGQ